MRDLIFISHRIPWPLNKGEKIRGWNLLQHLAPDYRIHLGCVVDDPADMAHVGRMEKVCASVGAFPIDKRVQKVRAAVRAAAWAATDAGFLLFASVAALGE